MDKFCTILFVLNSNNLDSATAVILSKEPFFMVHTWISFKVFNS